MIPAPDGTWAITGDAGWRGARYRYAVTVFAPQRRRVVLNEVTDPYSTALTVNSTHSVLVDFADPALAPAPWLAAPSPRLASPVDQVIYELHLRDFSISDRTVPEELRGSFLAPTVDSAGMAHLRRLAEAGLNTVQLLPLFDNATVEEHPGQQLQAAKDQLRSLPPDSPEQQRRVRALGGRSGFNWGYDPWHYFTPEGSYSSTLATADGAGRVAECRAMVGAFHGIGLRVVVDQVFNHTADAGQGSKSVLDRHRPRLLPPADRHRGRRDVELLPERGNRTPDGPEADGRRLRPLGPQLPGGRFPLRPDGPPQPREPARRPRRPRRAHDRRRRRGRAPAHDVRRGLELRGGRRQRALRPGDPGPARRHRGGDLLRPPARRRPRRLGVGR